MITWFKIALRNLFKNRRRSFITALAIALGFAAVNLFAGFTVYMYSGNRAIAVFGGCGGHLTIFKEGFLEKGKLDPARYLLKPVEIQAVKDICEKNPRVVLVTPQLSISGLISNGEISTIFIAQGIVPSAVDVFLSKFTMMQEMKGILGGLRLDKDKMYGVAMASGLARLLDLKKGSNAVAFTTTIDGQMNALDLEVLHTFDAPSDAMNDKAMRVPFSFAQTLYDTNRAERIAVLLTETEHTEPIRSQLQRAFSEKGLNLEVKTWEEMSQWYRRVKEMFDVIFAFLFTIVFIIVVMSVINTMSMTVIERTREIGTLRALGLKRRGVTFLFAIESTLLGIFGTIGGAILTFTGWWLTYLLKPTWIPPGMTRRVAINIGLVPETMLWGFVFLTVLCLLASLIPARRAAGENVVDALGHV